MSWLYDLNSTSTYDYVSNYTAAQSSGVVPHSGTTADIIQPANTTWLGSPVYWWGDSNNGTKHLYIGSTNIYTETEQTSDSTYWRFCYPSTPVLYDNCAYFSVVGKTDKKVKIKKITLYSPHTVSTLHTTAALTSAYYPHNDASMRRNDFAFVAGGVDKSQDNMYYKVLLYDPVNDSTTELDSASVSTGTMQYAGLTCGQDSTYVYVGVNNNVDSAYKINKATSASTSETFKGQRMFYGPEGWFAYFGSISTQKFLSNPDNSKEWRFDNFVPGGVSVRIDLLYTDAYPYYVAFTGNQGATVIATLDSDESITSCCNLTTNVSTRSVGTMVEPDLFSMEDKINNIIYHPGPVGHSEWCSVFPWRDTT
jgi:hypothetical protein